MSIHKSTKDKILLGAIAGVSLLIVVVLAVGFSVVSQQSKSVSQKIEIKIPSDEKTEKLDDSRILSTAQKQKILKLLSDESGELTPEETEKKLQKIEQEQESGTPLSEEEKKVILNNL